MGGAERVVHDSAVGQRDRGLDVAVLALLDPEGADPWLVTALRAQQVTTFACRSGRRGYVSEIRAIRHRVRELRPDVLHCHAYRGDVLGRLAAVGLDPALVATQHGFTGGGLKNRCYEWLDRMALRRFDAVIAVSAQLEARLKRSGVPAEKLNLVQNAFLPLPLIDRSEALARLGLDPSRVTIGWIGRVEREKGPDVFVEALALLQTGGIQAAIVGDGREREKLASTSRRLGIGHVVRFTGSIPDAGELLAAFDLVVLSSRTEGLPISLLEAMSAGVPVVATAVGEVPTATADGRFAQLVPAEDPAALAVAIDSVLADREQAKDTARQAAEWVGQQFGTDAWLDRIEDTYRRALRQRAARR
jgi:glycosyltransferase involved in cell wall biosynthesis